MGSGRKNAWFLKNSLPKKLYAVVLGMSMQSPNWMGTSCIKKLWLEHFCVPPCCSRKENIWVVTPFSSCNLICDLILRQFHELTKMLPHNEKINLVRKHQIICFVKTQKGSFKKVILFRGGGRVWSNSDKKSHEGEKSWAT